MENDSNEQNRNESEELGKSIFCARLKKKVGNKEWCLKELKKVKHL